MLLFDTARDLEALSLSARDLAAWCCLLLQWHSLHGLCQPTRTSVAVDEGLDFQAARKVSDHVARALDSQEEAVSDATSFGEALSSAPLAALWRHFEQGISNCQEQMEAIGLSAWRRLPHDELVLGKLLSSV